MDTMQRLERAMFLSPIVTRTIEELLQTAFWLEGFLRGSGLLLVHDETLWQLIDTWVESVNGEQFVEVLPLLRRTFSSFNENIRQQLSERIKRGEIPESQINPQSNWLLIYRGTTTIINYGYNVIRFG